MTKSDPQLEIDDFSSDSISPVQAPVIYPAGVLVCPRGSASLRGSIMAYKTISTL